MRGTIAAVLAMLGLVSSGACGKATSQDPGGSAGEDGGPTGPEVDAGDGLSCASAGTFATVCCGSGEPPATACAASWTSEQLCVGGASFKQTLFPTPCDGLVASNDAYAGGTITVFDAANGQPVAIVATNNPGLGLCVASDTSARVVPAKCLAQWEAPGTAPCSPKPAAAFVTLCSALSLPPQGCFVSAGSPPCALPTECVFPTTSACDLNGVCLVPPPSCQTQSVACGCVTGGKVTVCDGFAPQPAQACDGG